MQKSFCDLCGKELTSKEHWDRRLVLYRIQPGTDGGRKLRFEIRAFELHDDSPVDTTKDVCEDCALAAIFEGQEW